MGFVDTQEWRLHIHPGQSVTVVNHSHCEKLFPNIRLFFAQRCVRCLSPFHGVLQEDSGSVSFEASHYTVEDSNKSCLSLLFGKLNKFSSLSISSHAICSSPLLILVAVPGLVPVCQRLASAWKPQIGSSFATAKERGAISALSLL